MVNVPKILRGDVYLVDLDPTRGREIQKNRPCVVVSPDELNEHIQTFIVAPLTTGSHSYPFRVACRFRKQRGHVVLDQIRTVDRDRLVRHLGRLSPSAMEQCLCVLQDMFAH